MVSETPRDKQRLTTGVDVGGYSNKAYSSVSSGSFLSLAANVPFDMGQRIEDQTSYDLEIIETPRNLTGRWIVGRDAQRFESVRRFTRSLLRIDDILYDAFVTASLRVSFPDRFKSLDDYKANRYVIKGQWRKPVKLVLMVAPAHFSLAEKIINSVKGYYSFIDRRSGNLYTFTVERVSVLYEGWGIYSSRLYALASDGTVGISKDASNWKREKVSILDVGGRTLDVGTWENGRPVERQTGTEEIGIVTVAENIVSDLMRAYPGGFSNQPDPLTVIDAIEAGQRSRSKAVSMIGVHGKSFDITDLVNQHMNEFASRAFELYSNVLQQGQGIRSIVYGGGGAVLLRPYLASHIPFERQFMAGKTLLDMYMANAKYAYAYTAYKDQKERVR